MELVEVARRLLLSKTATECLKILEELLLNHGARYRPLGDIPGNHGAVEVGGDADSAMIERGTNAIDATMDLKAEQNPKLKDCKSPREFVAKAFDLPGGELAREENDATLDRLADEVGIEYHFEQGDKSRSMTVDIRDHGIGIAPDEMPRTILSLHGTNKIEKWYLVGQFGQGGAVTLRFSEYSIIFTRKSIRSTGEADLVGFTLLKYKQPENNERFGSYSYLVDHSGAPYRIPASAVSFDHGTLVRHVNYQVGFGRSLVPASAYAALHAKLFDPLLPAWMHFLNPSGGKDAGRTESRRIFGNRRRLTRSGYVEARDERWTNLGGRQELGRVIIRYWVLKPDVDKSTKGSFCDPNYPIHVTYMGQTHAVLPKGLLKDDCKLPFTYDHIIVQVDCDSVSVTGRRELFTATREAMTSEGRELIRTAIVDCLRDDPTLREIDEERRERLFQEGLKESTEELRRELAEMLDRVRPGKFIIASSSKSGGERRKKKPGHRGGVRGEPHATRPDFPTYVKIASFGDPLKVYLGSSRTILLETDAPDGFLGDTQREARLRLGPETDKYVTLLSQDTDFRHGYIRVTIEPAKGVPGNTSFVVEVALAFQADGREQTLADQRPGLIVKDTGDENKKQTKIDAPAIVIVRKDDSNWKRLAWNETHVAEVQGNGGKSIIYVSIENEWLAGTLTRVRRSRNYMDHIKKRYILQVAFHAFLQHDGLIPKEKLTTDEAKRVMEDPELIDELEKAELTRAVRSILTALTTKGAIAEASAFEEDVEA